MVDVTNTQMAYAPIDVDKQLSLEKEKDKDQQEKEFSFFGDDGMTFWDALDMINPLQHIPVVSTAYRAMTGDEIEPGARLAGGTIYGGPIGLAASAFNVLIEHNTGKDAGEHVIALFDGDEEPLSTEQPVFAQNPNEFETTNGLPSPAMSSFAPIQDIPQSEAAAFDAGEASLRLAGLQEFMNPNMVQEVPIQAREIQKDRQYQSGAGSLGTWQPPLNMDHPFPTERFNGVVSEPVGYRPAKRVADDKPSFTSHLDEPVLTSKQDNETVAQAPQAQQNQQLQGLSALQAFARDLKADKQALSQAQTGQVNPSAEQVQSEKQFNPIPSRTTQLSPTQDNAWFAAAMRDNMDRYHQHQDQN
jgi:hypothetical protein